MTPKANEQPRQPSGRWPFPGDSPLARARKIAHMYRAHLRALNPATCDAADDTARAFGETWAVPVVVTTTDDDWLTPAQAADLLCVSTARIRGLRLAGRLPGVRGRDGWRYRVADLRALQTQTRRRRPPQVVADH